VRVVVRNFSCRWIAEAAFVSCNYASAKSASAQLHEIEENLLGAGVLL